MAASIARAGASCSRSAGSPRSSATARVPSPHVGLVWDMLPTHRMGETPEQVWEVIGPRIFNVHVKDARRVPDGDGRQLVLLGEGEVPAREAISVLRRGGYEGWLVVEWEKRWHPELEDPDVALPHEIAMLRDWLQDI